METEITEILSAAMKAATAAIDVADPTPGEDRCVNALHRLKDNLLAHHQHLFSSVFHQVKNCIGKLEKHPQKKIRCLAIEVDEICKSKLDSKTSKISSMNPGDEPHETGSSVSNKSEKSSFMRADDSKLERPNSDRLVLNSVPLTKDKVRDQVRELVAEAMCKVSTEVVNDDDLQKKVSACDPYRTAASLETITFEKWGRFDGPQLYKYRSLMHNLKDPSNPDFRRKILLGQLPVHSIVELTWEEMGSDERQNRIWIMKDRAMIKLPRYDVWSCCLNSCTCKYSGSARHYLRCPKRGLNVGHRGWIRIGRRPKTKKRIACGSTK